MEHDDGGALLYHETQESKLCAVHCMNSVLQGPYFSELELASIARDLDQTEQAMMLEGEAQPTDFLTEGSSNVSLDGNFSIQVLQRALAMLDLKCVPLSALEAESARMDPQTQEAFICNLHEHWFTLRKVAGEWYNFNSLLAAPQHLSSFYMAAFLDTLKNEGWSIFVVMGQLPRDYNSAGKVDSGGGFGQWFTPEQARNVLELSRSPAGRNQEEQQQADEVSDDPMLSAAIAQSLRDSSGGGDGGSGGSNLTQEESDLAMAIAASLADLRPPGGTAPV